MSGADRRAPRMLPLVLFDDQGGVIDRHALAHEVSDKGFKIESQQELHKGQVVRFILSLDEAGDLKGRAKVVWSEKTDLSCWAGGQFLKLSWRDRRRIRGLMRTSEVDWNALADKAILALSILLVTLIAWSLLQRPLWRGIIGGLIPTAFAAFAMGWALRELLRRR